MATKRVYIDETIFEKLNSLYPEGDKQENLNNAVETFLRLRAVSLMEIKGVFTKPEIVGMIDAFNGTTIGTVPIPAKDMLIAQMEDSETYEFFSTRHGYEITELLTKIDNLTTAEAEFWLQELVRFWEELSSLPDSLEKFISDYEHNPDPNKRDFFLEGRNSDENRESITKA